MKQRAPGGDAANGGGRGQDPHADSLGAVAKEQRLLR
jgi:hypothetical protein